MNTSRVNTCCWVSVYVSSARICWSFPLEFSVCWSLLQCEITQTSTQYVGQKCNPSLGFELSHEAFALGPIYAREWVALPQKINSVIAALTFSSPQKCWHHDVWLHMTADITVCSLPQHASFQTSRTPPMRTRSRRRCGWLGGKNWTEKDDGRD